MKTPSTERASGASSRFRGLLSWAHGDLTAVYSRDTRKWVVVAPLIGVVTALVITGIVLVILDFRWSRLLPLYYRHHLLIIPLTTLGFLVTGLSMQYLTPDPNEHSTEEIISSYIMTIRGA